MRESSTYQGIRNDGRAEGIALGVQNSVLAALRKRFGAVPPEVEARVRAVTDIARLGRADNDAARLRAALYAVVNLAAPGELPL